MHRLRVDVANHSYYKSSSNPSIIDSASSNSTDLSFVDRYSDLDDINHKPALSREPTYENKLLHKSPIMGFNVALLWKAPEINPVNGKARSIPVLNPFNKYGRVFFFAWLGFMVAFLSW